MEDTRAYLPPDDVITEHAYLVARGVRPLALIGHCPADPTVMLCVATRLERLREAGTIPFVLERGDGHADYGFAAESWALDLYRWVSTEAVPDRQRHRIIGLLLGYSPDAIRRYEEEAGGRLFRPPTASPERAAS